MSWIETIPYEASTGRLRSLYDRIKGPNGMIDNILLLHGLRPHTLEGHMVLYKNVLHHAANRLPKSLLETIGVHVSMLNKCAYCVEHHFEGLRKLLDNDVKAVAVREGLESGDWTRAFDEREQAVLRYVNQLTLKPEAMQESDLGELREHGFTDGDILEINQVTAYFAYANRTVLGLGCSLDGDVLGLSPGDADDPDNWHHG